MRSATFFRLAGPVLSLCVLSLLASEARAEEAGDPTHLEELLREGTDPTITLSEDYFNNGGDQTIVMADLGRGSKTLELYDSDGNPMSVPPMNIYNGTLTVVGGVINEITQAAADADRGDSGSYEWSDDEQARHLIKVYADTSVVFSDTGIQLGAPDDASPEIPPTVFALYSDGTEPGLAGAPDTTAPASLVLEGVGMPNEDNPLQQALVISWGGRAEYALTVKDSDLLFGPGGTLHGTRWDSEPDDFEWSAGIEVSASKLRMSEDAAYADEPIGAIHSGTARMPFLAGDGVVFIQSSLLSGFTTASQPLLTAPNVQLLEVLVQDVHRDDERGGLLVEGLNVALGGSLICGLSGGEAVVHLPQEGDLPATRRSAHLMSSALWQIDSSLFTMETEASDASTRRQEEGLFAQNLTLQRAEAAGSGPVIDFDGASGLPGPPGILRNVYLEGGWTLGEALQEVSTDDLGMLAVSLTMADPARNDDLCEDKTGCASYDAPLLPSEAVDPPCAELFEPFTKLLSTGGGTGFNYRLSDLQLEDSDVLLAFEAPRPAIVAEPSLLEGESWAFRDADEPLPGTWEGTLKVSCAAEGEDALFVGAYAQAGEMCSLDVLAPFPPVEEEEDEATPPDEATLPDEGPQYGLASGCRSSLAGVVALAPLLGLRRRRPTRSRARK